MNIVVAILIGAIVGFFAGQAMKTSGQQGQITHAVAGAAGGLVMSLVLGLLGPLLNAIVVAAGALAVVYGLRQARVLK